MSTSDRTVPPVSANQTPTDPFELGLTTIEAANERGITLRLFGGQAVRYLTPAFPARTRNDQDVDFATTSSQTDAVINLLKELGFHADDRFNALHGRRQLYFATPDGTASVDVVVDKLTMCHELTFGDRIDSNPVTLDLTDLLLTKLQIVEINEKDLQDIIYLLSAYPVRDADDAESISLRRFGDVIAADWGWWRTVTGTLDTLASLPPETWRRLQPPTPPVDARGSIRTLRTWADDVPKSRRWRLRSRLGERVRWYESPEEESH